MPPTLGALLGALVSLTIGAVAGVLYLAHRPGQFERAMQAVVQDYDTTLQAMKDSLADLDEVVASVDETVQTIQQSPLVQSLLATPVQDGDVQDG